MNEYISYYNSMTLYERLIFRKICRLDRRKRKAFRQLERRMEGIDELLEDVENTKD